MHMAATSVHCDCGAGNGETPMAELPSRLMRVSANGGTTPTPPVRPISIRFLTGVAVRDEIVAEKLFERAEQLISKRGVAMGFGAGG
jgi:hypothetical protein